MKNKKGQMTVWIILAILLVVTMLIFFFFNRAPRIDAPSGGEGGLDVESFITQCMREHVNDVVDIILPQGGFVNPGNYKTFDEKPVEYLCENVQNYKPCINQHPMLLREIEEEITDYVAPEVGKCLEDMKKEFERRGSDVEFENTLDPEVTIDLGQDRIFIDVEKEMRVVREKDVRSYQNFDIEITSPLYNLAIIANEIASQEAKYCNFESKGYTLTYPRYNVKMTSLSLSSSRIYEIKDEKSGKVFVTAIRSCALPPGV